jgi:YggT family protein
MPGFRTVREFGTARLGLTGLWDAGRAATSGPALVRSRTGLARIPPRVPFWSLPAMRALLDVIGIVLQLYVYALIVSAILSWLIAFNVVNVRNDFVRGIMNFLYQITEPVLAPIRRRMPNLGGIDISPIVVILIIILLQGWIRDYLYPLAF